MTRNMSVQFSHQIEASSSLLVSVLCKTANRYLVRPHKSQFCFFMFNKDAANYALFQAFYCFSTNEAAFGFVKDYVPLRSCT